MTAAAPMTIRGWCPGAHRPMASGDGLILRIRPPLGRVDIRQIEGLAEAARKHGGGMLALTSRANLQMRGLDEAAAAEVVTDLVALGLADADPDLEAKRNILVEPTGASDAIAAALAGRLAELPDLPAKFGFAVDLGPRPVLTDASADVRIELGGDGNPVVRADGAATGRATTDPVQTAIALAAWFGRNRGPARRMRQVSGLPPEWRGAAAAPAASCPAPGPSPAGPVLGAPFGQLPVDVLEDLMRASGARGIRMLPWRLFVLEGASRLPATEFVTTPGHPLMRVDACPGAPFCPAATVETRALARALAGRAASDIHVSGCAKGCARAAPADVTLVGRDGAFDLVRHGDARSAPVATGLSPAEALREAGR